MLLVTPVHTPVDYLRTSRLATVVLGLPRFPRWNGSDCKPHYLSRHQLTEGDYEGALIEYISYSQLNTYEQCPRQWYLSRIVKAREKQTWYMPMGTAVHTVLEQKILTGLDVSFEAVFYDLVRKQRKIEADTSQWLAGGPKDAPYMREKVVEMGKACVANGLAFFKDFEVEHVEYDLSGPLPGLDVPIKGFGDYTGKHKEHGKLVVDAKTSADKPKNNVQLETYSARYELMHGERPNGYWLMLRPGAKPKTDKARYVDMTNLDVNKLGARYQRAYEKMQQMIVPATSTFCDFCSQKPNCLAQSGPTERAKFYDKSESDGIPF